MKLNINQRGIAPVVLVVLVVLVLGVAGGAYYMVNNSDKNSSDSSQSAEDKAASEAISEACKTEVNDDDFCRYAANISNLYSYKEPFTAVTSGGESGSSTIKSDGKGNMHMIVESSEGSFETITYNNTTYTKYPGKDVWYKMPNAQEAQEDTSEALGNIDYDFGEETGPKTIYKNLGEEACGNLTCIKYQTYQEDKPSETWTVWFDTKDFKTRRTEVVYDGSTVTTIYTYENVTINEPTPVEDLPDYSNMSQEELLQQAEQLQQMYGN